MLIHIFFESLAFLFIKIFLNSALLLIMAGVGLKSNDLSSDAGLLLIKEFAAKIGFTKLINKKFKTNDKSVRFHKDDENLMQMIYQIIHTLYQMKVTK